MIQIVFMTLLEIQVELAYYSNMVKHEFKVNKHETTAFKLIPLCSCVYNSKIYLKKAVNM